MVNQIAATAHVAEDLIIPKTGEVLLNKPNHIVHLFKGPDMYVQAVQRKSGGVADPSENEYAGLRRITFAVIDPTKGRESAAFFVTVRPRQGSTFTNVDAKILMDLARSSQSKKPSEILRDVENLSRHESLKIGFHYTELGRQFPLNLPTEVVVSGSNPLGQIGHQHISPLAQKDSLTQMPLKQRILSTEGLSDFVAGRTDILAVRYGADEIAVIMRDKKADDVKVIFADIKHLGLINSRGFGKEIDAALKNIGKNFNHAFAGRQGEETTLAMALSALSRARSQVLKHIPQEVLAELGVFAKTRDFRRGLLEEYASSRKSRRQFRLRGFRMWLKKEAGGHENVVNGRRLSDLCNAVHMNRAESGLLTGRGNGQDILMGVSSGAVSMKQADVSPENVLRAIVQAERLAYRAKTHEQVIGSGGEVNGAKPPSIEDFDHTLKIRSADSAIIDNVISAQSVYDALLAYAQRSDLSLSERIWVSKALLSASAQDTSLELPCTRYSQARDYRIGDILGVGSNTDQIKVYAVKAKVSGFAAANLLGHNEADKIFNDDMSYATQCERPEFVIRYNGPECVFLFSRKPNELDLESLFGIIAEQHPDDFTTQQAVASVRMERELREALSKMPGALPFSRIAAVTPGTIIMDVMSAEMSTDGTIEEFFKQCGIDS